MCSMDEDFDSSMRQLLVDDAILFSGLEAATFLDGVDRALAIGFDSSSSPLVKLLRTRLFAANRRQSFVFGDETAIPHVVLDGHDPVVGWFRSIDGLPDP